MLARRVYMDHAATTPMDGRVWKSMAPFATETFGNPSSLHQFGRDARLALDRARGKVARLIGCLDDEIVFTSGGTESDNLAIRGVAMARRDTHRHIITSAIEHHAVLDPCRFLEQQGFEITILPVDGYGLVDLRNVAAAIRPDTALLTIMMANNEIGTIQSIKEITALAKENNVLVHSDAVQACGVISIDTQNLGVDLLSISGHKLYGPKGVGALYVRKGTPLIAHNLGGDQERKKRGGTENVQGAVGFGTACEIALEELDENSARLKKFRDLLIADILNRIPEVKLNGHPTQRLPGNANFTFAGTDNQSLLINLDLAGIAASNGSACASGSPQPSHVLPAIGRTEEETRSSLRLSLGKGNTEDDVEYVVEHLCRVVEKIRRAEKKITDVEMMA
ncbi:MAG: cysteine desulfurase family protein [Planctomycetota bacterium]|nr:cysteine desulfurase family protein [Planctomycetota bacterium]MDA1141900.1 cysteine desulfurase family protein [Planctomycetota bacterium]